MAQLAPVVDALEAVAEPLRQFYVPKDGKFALDLGGTPAGFVPAADLALANTRLVEFRDNNITLKKTVDELTPLKTAFDGIDPAAARAALAAQEELKKKGITKPDDVTAMREAILNDVKTTLVKPLQDQLLTITTTAQETQKANDALTLRQFIGEKFGKAGGEPNALNFIVSQAQGVFKVVGGKVVAEAAMFSTDRPGEPLSVDEWLTQQTKSNAFAFKASSGSGANPTPGGAGGGGNRPAGQLILKDPTPQQLGTHAADIKAGKMRVEYTDPVPK
jgi:hypothetical protein